MSIIHFCGRVLDYDYDALSAFNSEQWPRIVVRGYDRAGNELIRIRDNLQLAADPGGTSYTGANRYGVATQVALRYLDNYGRYEEPPAVQPRCLAIDAAGHIYMALGSYWSGQAYELDLVQDFIRVYRRAGDRIDFPQLHGAHIYAIEIAANGDLLIGGGETATGRYYLRRYSAAGSLLWSGAVSDGDWTEPATLHTHCVTKIAEDASGNLYIAGGGWSTEFYESDDQTYAGFVASYTGSGTFRWKVGWASGNVDSLAVVGDCVYTTGHPYAYYAQTLDSTWTLFDSRTYLQQWDAATGALLAENAVAAGISRIGGATIGGIYSGALYLFRNRSTATPGDGWDYQVVDPTTLAVLDEQLLFPNSYYPLYSQYRFFDLDTDGALYHARRAKNHFRKIALDYSNPWDGLQATGQDGRYASGAFRPMTEQNNYGTLTYAPYTYTTAYGNRAGPDYDEYWYKTGVRVAPDSPTPALSLGVALGLPTFLGETFTMADGLPLLFGLPLPALRRDYVGDLALPAVYRLDIEGALTGLPLSAISCRRAVGTLDLSVSVPDPSLIAALEALIDSDIVVYRGWRFPDGAAQQEEFLRAPLQRLRGDAGASSGTIGLSGTREDPAGTARTRTLQGVSYASSTSSGGRRYRCAIDTFLRPGDTALLAGEDPLIVESIVYSIAPDAGYMEIVGP